MSHCLGFLVVCVVLNAGMDCNDGIYAHFKVVNNDFIDICNHVNVRSMNGSISDNIINDTILRIQNPFYLELDHIPIYPFAIDTFYMGIHIQGYTQLNHIKPNETILHFNKSARSAFLGSIGDKDYQGYSKAVWGDPGNGNVYVYASQYITKDVHSSSYVNWTLHYSNAHNTMSYFKDNVYIRTDSSVNFASLNFLNVIGGPYYPKVYREYNWQYGYITGYYVYDSIFVKNIIISKTTNSDINGFQDYILGNDIQSNHPTKTPVCIPTETTNKPTQSNPSESQNTKVSFNMDNIYQNLFYGLLGVIVGILSTILINICIKNKNKKQINNQISKDRLLSNNNNNNDNIKRISINN